MGLFTTKIKFDKRSRPGNGILKDNDALPNPYWKPNMIIKLIKGDK